MNYHFDRFGDDIFAKARAARHHVSPDIMQGAREIAVFLFGTPKARRRVYDLHAEGVLPTFNLGKTICARRTSLIAWIENQERRSGEVA
jgi:hypothetical protein